MMMQEPFDIQNNIGIQSMDQHQNDAAREVAMLMQTPIQEEVNYADGYNDAVTEINMLMKQPF